VSVVYPGGEGAHSAAACEALFPDGELRPLPSFQAVAKAVAEHEAEAGVLPIESSLVGPVAETHDLLYDSPLAITGQVVLPIHHCLAAPGQVPLEEIRTVHSHPVALDQCRSLLASMPWATAIAAATTGDAARHVAELGDPSQAALASRRAAALYGLTVVADDVGDQHEAYTRFVSIATYMRLARNGKPFRTAFSFMTDHRPGALHRAIEPFARHSIDLVQLVSRPIPQTPWRYRFDCVLAGHPLDPIVRETLAETAAQTRELRIFGSYPTE
jgi:prephenate dehydratase